MKTAEQLLKKAIEKYNQNCPLISQIRLSDARKEIFIDMMNKYAKAHVIECVNKLNEKALNSHIDEICNGVLLNEYQLSNIK